MTENGGKLPPRKFILVDGERLSLWEPVIGICRYEGREYILSRDKDGFERPVPPGYGVVTVPEFDNGVPLDVCYLVPSHAEVARRVQEIRDHKAARARDDLANELEDARRATASAEKAREDAERNISASIEKTKSLRAKLGLGGA